MLGNVIFGWGEILNIHFMQLNAIAYLPPFVWCPVPSALLLGVGKFV
jgi:hypothetical protein